MELGSKNRARLQRRRTDFVQGFSLVAFSTSTFNVFFEARILASSFEPTAVAVTPSGETVTTRYGIPDFGGAGGAGLSPTRFADCGVWNARS